MRYVLKILDISLAPTHFWYTKGADATICAGLNQRDTLQELRVSYWHLQVDHVLKHPIPLLPPNQTLTSVLALEWSVLRPILWNSIVIYLSYHSQTNARAILRVPHGHKSRDVRAEWHDTTQLIHTVSLLNGHSTFLLSLTCLIFPSSSLSSWAWFKFHFL